MKKRLIIFLGIILSFMITTNLVKASNIFTNLNDNVINKKEQEINFLEDELVKLENSKTEHENESNLINEKLVDLKDVEKTKEQEKLRIQKDIDNLKQTKEKIEEEMTKIIFGSDGLLEMEASGKTQNVINLLLGIPGHANGSSYHISTGLDNYIDELTVKEALYVVHKIEGQGFGQTGSGFAGIDSPESHKTFVQIQLEGRFGGSVHSLLKAWGTYSYGGY